MEKNIEDYRNVDGENHCLMHGQDSQDFFNERKATWRMYMVREAYQETNNLSCWWCMARYVEAYVWCSEKKKKQKQR